MCIVLQPVLFEYAPEMAAIGTKLRDRAQELGLSDAEVARRAGLHPRRYSNYVNDEREPDFETLLRICMVLETTPNALFEIAGAATAATAQPATRRPAAPGMAVLREIDVRASAGAGAIVESESPIAQWGFPEMWLRASFGANPGELHLITVEGDSMEPVLAPGDKVMVDTGRQVPSPPGIFVLYDGFATVVKRLEHIPNSDPPTIHIKSANPAYDSYDRTADEINVVGRVIGVWRRL